MFPGLPTSHRYMQGCGPGAVGAFSSNTSVAMASSPGGMSERSTAPQKRKSRHPKATADCCAVCIRRLPECGLSRSVWHLATACCVATSDTRWPTTIRIKGNRLTARSFRGAVAFWLNSVPRSYHRAYASRDIPMQKRIVPYRRSNLTGE